MPGETVPDIRIIQPHQVQEAKTVICAVVLELFGSTHGPDAVAQLVQQYDARNELDDITDFQGHYLDNDGLFLVLMSEGKVVGTGGIRKLTPEIAELKRMWFLPEFRGRGFGRQLAEQLLQFARQKQYQRVRLDTDERQTAAIRLYKRLGFQPIDRYNQSVCNRFMELELRPGAER